jgi:NAD(P)-dependent dehydrogenase (short-subunit alcohol dehydrogenase family)
MIKTVLITGASTGIGRACALHLARAGYQVIAGVRKPEHGRALQSEWGANLSWVILDVTDADSITSAAREVSKQTGDGGLFGLVNNAGIVVGGPLEYLPIDEFRKQLEVNVTGLLAVTQAMLPHLRKASGRVINMGSISGKVAYPFLGAYSVSKFAVEALSDSLRMELGYWGLPVVVIEPGRIETPIWDKSLTAAETMRTTLPAAAESHYGRIMETIRKQVSWAKGHSSPALRVAKAVEKALSSKNPRARYMVGNDARLQLLAKNILPTRLMDSMVRKLLGPAQ